MLMGFIVHEELLDMMVEEGVIDVFADLALKLDESSISHGDSSRLMATIQSTTNNCTYIYIVLLLLRWVIY